MRVCRGQRIALNIAWAMCEKEQLNRGDWLLSMRRRGRLFPGDRFFWRFMRRFPNGSRQHIHHAASHVTGRVFFCWKADWPS